MPGPEDFFSPGQWQDPLQDPRARAALLQTGIQLAQPRSWGQSGFGSFLGALGSGAEAVQRADTQDRQDTTLDQKQQEVDSKGELRVAQAELAGARAGQAGTIAAVAQDRLELAKKEQGLKYDRYKNMADLAERKWAGQMEIAQTKLGQAQTAEERKAATAEVNRIAKEAHTEQEGLRTDFMKQRIDTSAAADENKNKRLDIMTQVRMGTQYQNHLKNIDSQNAALDKNVMLSKAEKDAKRQTKPSFQEWKSTIYSGPGGNSVPATPPTSPSDVGDGSDQTEPGSTTPQTAPQTTQAPPAPPVGSRQQNTVYQTNVGPMRWTGTGWVKP